MEAPLSKPILAVDVVCLRHLDGALRLLLPPRSEGPFLGSKALPGVALRTGETLLAAATRALIEKATVEATAIASLYLEQLAAFDALYRDPRGRTVSVAHLALASPVWQDLNPHWEKIEEIDTGRLPFDHKEILESAISRLRGKIKYTNIASTLLPAKFEFRELRSLYGTILARELNPSNLRTTLLRQSLIERIGQAQSSRRVGRPAHLYRFRRRDLDLRERDFL